MDGATAHVVILTAKADSHAVQAAKAMDVNGFAVAPLSFEKLVKTMGLAINRTWTLQAASIYAGVPRVEPTLVAPEKAPSTGHKRGVIMKSESNADETGHASHRPVAAAGIKPFPRRAPELKNVHMCSLTEVRPGAILARDILDRSGQLLLKTGTVLKPTLLDRLANVADGHSDSYHVWIGEWDDATT